MRSSQIKLDRAVAVGIKLTDPPLRAAKTGSAFTLLHAAAVRDRAQALLCVGGTRAARNRNIFRGSHFARLLVNALEALLGDCGFLEWERGYASVTLCVPKI